MKRDPVAQQQREENRGFLDEVMMKEGARKGLRDDLRDLGIQLATEPMTGETPIQDLRRRRRRRADDPVSVVTLTEDDGVFRWELGPGFHRPDLPASGRRRGRRRGGPSSGSIVTQLKFRDLPPNEVDIALGKLDAKLTPDQGLRRVEKTPAGTWRVGSSDQVPVPTGRILLLVHGTFSHVGNLLGELETTGAGRDFLDWAAGRYQQILAFNHPTLSVSPVMNATDLARHFRSSKADVDIVCHSRGGLVTRWWNEGFDQGSGRRTRVVFVGSPLAGTSLASPHRLKDTINLITNVSKVLTTGARAGAVAVPMAAPLFTAAAGLLRVFTRVTSFAAKTPLVDAGVALVPGLAGQSRQGANSQILRLREGFAAFPLSVRSTEFLRRYYFVASNFEPKDPGWRFWKYFNKKQVVNAGADRLFDGANDLVVDTASMTDLVDDENMSEAQKRILRTGHLKMYRRSDTVHHTNYFQQVPTIRFIREKLSG